MKNMAGKPMGGNASKQTGSDKGNKHGIQRGYAKTKAERKTYTETGWGIMQGERKRGNQKYYSKLKGPIYPDTIPLVTQIINKLHEKKFIKLKQKMNLIGDCQPLHKIHKDP